MGQIQRVEHVDETMAAAAAIDEMNAPAQVTLSAVAALNRSDVEAQLAAAHQHPRKIARFLNEAITLATMTKGIAEACIYAIPRDGKLIKGPSVRLAEICASAYGNMHIGARICDVEEKEVVAQGIAWDLEKNLRTTIETRRRITGKGGRRYSDDMITVTGNAAASIALRNAIFRVIPKAYVQQVYDRARLTAVGDAKTLVAKRDELLERLAKIGVHADRVFQLLGKQKPDIDLDDIELLIGLGTAIANGDLDIDDAFPAPLPTSSGSEDGRRISLRGGAKKEAEAKHEAKKAAAPEGEPPIGMLADDAPMPGSKPQREPGSDG